MKYFFLHQNFSDVLNFLAPYYISFGNFLTVNISDRGLALLGAGMATTGCLGAGIGQGFSAGKACESIGRNPDAINKVRTIMIIGAAIAESGAIYSLLIALILIFAVQ
ncbi:ATP synthase F0 subunit C [Mycoplasma sp. SG1]|uniref:ATP synthase F0 subunit C n=1 Tax=Mycoplasma sp. SG1 TaxID=2810348 RepID=UPI0020257F07|nr:ATP synthase F0 subunit C [Mycoplasma sp. SG1]URM52969.1 ATP synthase F0 subunit C [Mycoplasma sp. SG1]